MGISLYIIFCLLVLIFFLSPPPSFISMCLGMFLLGFILPGTLQFLDFCDCFLFHVREILSYYLFKYFLKPLLSLFFWDIYNVNVGEFNVVLRYLKLSSFIYILFYLFCYAAVISTNLSSSTVVCSSASFTLLLISSSIFLVSVAVLFISVFPLYLLVLC